MKANLAKLCANASNYDLKLHLNSEDYSPRSLDTALLAIIQGYFAPEAKSTIQKVKTLIDCGASPHMKGPSNQTLLMKASQYGNVVLVEYLVDKGARVYDTDSDGRTPLIHACMSRNDNIEVVQFLLSKSAQVADKDNYGRIALHFASKNGLFYSVQSLVSSNSQLVDVKDSQGNTPLDLAREHNHVHVIEILKPPANSTGKGGKIRISDNSSNTRNPPAATLYMCTNCQKQFPIEQLQIVRTQGKDPKHYCKNCYRPPRQQAPKVFNRQNSERYKQQLNSCIEDEKQQQVVLKGKIEESNAWIDRYNQFSHKNVVNNVSLEMTNHSTLGNKQNLVRTLNNEISDFMGELNTWQDQVSGVYLNVIEYLRTSCQEVWPGSQLEVFGSYGTQLYLPSSDIDLVVTGAPSNLTNVEVLTALNNRFRQQGALLFKDLTLIPTATIPILTMKIELEEGSVSIDFTVHDPGHHGITHCQLINSYLEKYSNIRPLFLILKHFLYFIQLQKAYTGGLSSYGLFLLVVSFYQTKEVSGRSIGQLLFDLFQYYGFEFYFEEHALYPQLPTETRHIPVLQNKQFEAEDSYRLQIFDPINPTNNVTRSSNPSTIMSAFRFAYN